MQQRFRRLALFVAATTLASAGVMMVACGTDNGTTPTPTLEASTPKDSGGNTADTSTDPDGGGPVDAAAEAACTKNPVLRDTTKGFRCAFLTTGGDAGPICLNTETCCNPNDKAADGGFEFAFCAPAKGGDTQCMGAAAAKGSAYTTGAAWECADKEACTTGVCCMIQDPVRLAADPVNNKLKVVVNTKDKLHPATCGALDALNAGGSRCKAACDGAMNDLQLCSMTNPTCPAATTCTPFYDYTHFVDRGFCKAN